MVSPIYPYCVSATGVNSTFEHIVHFEASWVLFLLVLRGLGHAKRYSQEFKNWGGGCFVIG